MIPGARACLLLLLALAQPAEPPEVRQLVSFRFLPGRAAEAIRLFREEALPLYHDNEPMLRFRGYREAESPVPVDLVVVSTFRGMAGMDASNQSLRDSARARGSSVGAIYGSIAAESVEHRDEFVEIDSDASWGDADSGPMIVLIRMEIAPGARDAFERLIRDRLVPWERGLGPGIRGADGGPFLVSDGWDAFRVLAIESLGDWHAYLRARRNASWRRELDRIVVRERQTILVGLPELSVR